MDGIRIPRVAAALSPRDRLDAVRSRLVSRRERIRIEPGLYAVGDPRPGSPVLVTANYKPSFDGLRSVLTGRDAWLLVLDTRGVNVWCAAGKGTFGDRELLRRIAATRLDMVAPGSPLVLPQLGAVGVSAFRIAKESGRRVHIGPIRAADLPAYLDAGCSATPEMRLVRFGLRERAVLIPREVVAASIPLAAGWVTAIAVAYGSSLLGSGGTSPMDSLALGTGIWLAPAAGAFSGLVLVPLLLPLLPTRSFAIKGAAAGTLTGLAWCAALALGDALMMASGLLAATGVSAFLGLNFTGSTTYTSLAGVRKELRIALPAIVAGLLAAFLLAALSALRRLGGAL